jgi:hypothetical protein
MQRIDLSKHHVVRGIASNKSDWHEMPYKIQWQQPDSLDLWILTEPGLYQWRGLINKVTGQRMTYQHDWVGALGQFQFFGGILGVEYDLVLVVK